jgi:hypothetical protein
VSRRIGLLALILYAAAGMIDGSYHLAAPPHPVAHASTAGNLAIAFCAGLFWPIDIVARPLLISH